MERIVIIGPPGAGKTTLAKKMGSLLKIKVIHLDRIFWKRGWQAVARDERMDSLQKLVSEKRWIMEGTYIDLSQPRLDAADTIIFLDIHPAICLWRIVKRHWAERGRFRRDIPLECADKITLLRIWWVLFFPFREDRRLKKNLREISPEKIIPLNSTKKVKAFLAQPEQYIHEKRQSAKIPSVLGQELQHFSFPFPLLNNRCTRQIQHFFQRRSASLYIKAQEAEASSVSPII